jgi:hypothetical protein
MPVASVRRRGMGSPEPTQVDAALPNADFAGGAARGWSAGVRVGFGPEIADHAGGNRPSCMGFLNPYTCPIRGSDRPLA